MRCRVEVPLTLAFIVLAASAPAQTSIPAPPSATLQAPLAPPNKPPEQSDPNTKKTDSAPKPKPVPPEDLWLYPAQRVSADLESQSWRTRHDLHAIGLATLGAAWWKQDRATAEHWVYPAVDEVTLASQESEEARENRLESAQRILAIVAPLDPNLRERLKDVIKSAAREEDQEGPTAAAHIADGLVRAAQTEGPAELSRVISEALPYGITSAIVDGIRSLRPQMPEEAEQLFGRALAQASNSRQADELLAFAGVLASAAATNAPDEWARQVSATYIRALSDSNWMSQDERCDLAQSGFLQPNPGTELAQAVTAVSVQCTTGSDPVLAADTQVVQRSNPHTSDEYLSAAGQSKSPVSRYKLKVSAAEKAEKEDVDSDSGGPVRALGIFDTMTAEERAVKPGEYKRLRAQEAIRAALHTAGKSGCTAGVRVVDSSPRDTVFHVAVGVSEKIDSRCLGQVIDTALRQMRRNPPDDPDDYIRLMNVVLRRQMEPGYYHLQEILRGMDEWKQKDRKMLVLGDFVYQARWNDLVPMGIAQEIFDLGAERLSAIARGYFRNDLLRTDFELFLVRGFLDRYAREAAKRKAELAAEAEKP